MSNDPWNIGSYHKNPIWVFYLVSNYVGVILSLLTIHSIHKNQKRNASDLFVGSLCSGCAMLSFTCGTQCLINRIFNRFYGGDIACQMEAIFHISSVLVEFFSVALMTWAYSVTILHPQKQISNKWAWKCIAVVWILCITVTSLGSLFSPIYLMSAGTYCFFGFTSFEIALWLVPGLIIALITMCVYHVKVLREFKAMILTTRATHNQMMIMNSTTPISSMNLWLGQFKWRSTLFIIILLLGWGFAAVTTIVELTIGKAPEWLVTAVGVGGVSFSWWAPIAYATTCDIQRATMIKFFGWVFIPYYGKQWWYEKSSYIAKYKLPPSRQKEIQARNSKVKKEPSTGTLLPGDISPSPLITIIVTPYENDSLPTNEIVSNDILIGDLPHEINSESSTNSLRVSITNSESSCLAS